MNWQDLKKRWGLHERVHHVPFVTPVVALELQPGFVTGARLNPGKGHVERAGIRQLDAGALVPSPNRPNLTNLAAVKRAVGEVAALLGNGSDRLGLLIPDVSVRVALLNFETLPENRREEETVVRWRLREFLPYAPEEARVSYQVVAKQANGAEVLAMAVRASVLAEYEAALEGINGGPALVLSATAALLPLLPEEKTAQLLLHLCPGSLTTVLVVMNRICLWRTRPFTDESEDVAGEVVREGVRSVATCQDQFGTEAQRVWFCARPPAANGLKERLAGALGREVLPLRWDPASATGLSGDERETFQHFGVPFAGLLANPGE